MKGTRHKRHGAVSVHGAGAAAQIRLPEPHVEDGGGGEGNATSDVNNQPDSVVAAGAENYPGGPAGIAVDVIGADSNRRAAPSPRPPKTGVWSWQQAIGLVCLLGSFIVAVRQKSIIAAAPTSPGNQTVFQWQ